MSTPTLSSPTSHHLGSEQIAAYQRDGYLILRGLYTPEEAAAFQQESDRLMSSGLVHPDNLRTRHRKLENATEVVERIDPVIDVSPLFHKVVHDSRITTALEDLFGEPARLFKDKLIFKAPAMSGYTMHQDYAWWQPQGDVSELPDIHPDKILSVMVAIDAADALNGAIELFPAAHHTLLSTPGELRNLNDDEIKKIDLSTAVLGETAPGDVVIFHSLTPHRSELNRSPRSRRQLYMTYNAASAGDVYAKQQAHYRSYALKGRDENGLFFK
ncbi:MAG TPA: phytanoyl-CoA dioxygenase family protein [Chthoniobacteraceae bacterium]|nr:phytanoyl-CoA dioxygenase family protein [Chthoniobacteraceae bacterium]